MQLSTIIKKFNVESTFLQGVAHSRTTTNAHGCCWANTPAVLNQFFDTNNHFFCSRPTVSVAVGMV
jgi:hypothetical protein